MRRHHFIGELAGFRRADLHSCALPEYPRLAFNRAFQEPAIPLDVSLTVTERGKPVDMNFSLPTAALMLTRRADQARDASMVIGPHLWRVPSRWSVN